MSSEKSFLKTIVLAMVYLLISGYSNCGYAGFEYHDYNNGQQFVNISFTECEIDRSIATKIIGTLTHHHVLNLTLGTNKFLEPGALAMILGALLTNRTLAGLEIYGNSIDEAGVRAFVGALQENITLTYLGLHANLISDEGIQAIIEALDGHRALTTFYLGRERISSESIRAIAGLLRSNAVLAKLHLPKCSIDSEKARIIAEALRENEGLTQLFLNDNQIGAEGAQAIAEALRENSTLTYLDLSENQIGDQGAYAIAEALRENNTLTDLVLDKNHLGGAGILAIARALQTNTRLKVLSFQHYGIGKVDWLPIAMALEANIALTDSSLLEYDRYYEDKESNQHFRVLIRRISERNALIASIRKALMRPEILALLAGGDLRLGAESPVQLLDPQVIKAIGSIYYQDDAVFYIRVREMLSGIIGNFAGLSENELGIIREINSLQNEIIIHLRFLREHGQQQELPRLRSLDRPHTPAAGAATTSLLPQGPRLPNPRSLASLHMGFSRCAIL